MSGHMTAQLTRGAVLLRAAWSLGHGIAKLWLDGELADSYDDPGTLTIKITRFLESILTSPQPRSR